MATALAVIALATWRLANMLSDPLQEGPGELLNRLRYRAGVRFNELSEAYGTNNFSRGLLCIYCCSVWFGIAFAVLYLLSPVIAFYLALPFALSAAAVIIDKFV